MSTGNLILNDERFDLKDIINFNQIIGKIHIGNVYIETIKGKVHYSKTGALNNKSDEYGIKRNRHAQIYYNSVRNQENR